MTLIDDGTNTEVLWPELRTPDGIADKERDGEDGDGSDGGEGQGEAAEKTVRVPLVAVAALLSGTAGAWLASRLFTGGVFPFGVAMVGVAIGVGAHVPLVPLGPLGPSPVPRPAHRGRRRRGVRRRREAGKGSANLTSLIVDAVKGGGLGQPPVPFDPGWRFVFVVLFAVVSAAGLALAVNLARPQLAVAFPLPVVLGAALLPTRGLGGRRQHRGPRRHGRGPGHGLRRRPRRRGRCRWHVRGPPTRTGRGTARSPSSPASS